MFLHVEAWRGILNDSTKRCYGVIVGEGQKCIFARCFVPVNVSGMSETGKCRYLLVGTYEHCTYLPYISGMVVRYSLVVFINCLIYISLVHLQYFTRSRTRACVYGRVYG